MMSLFIFAGYALLTGIFFFLKEDLRYVALSKTSKTSAQFSDSLLLIGLSHVNRCHRAF